MLACLLWAVGQSKGEGEEEKNEQTGDKDSKGDKRPSNEAKEDNQKSAADKEASQQQKKKKEVGPPAPKDKNKDKDNKEEPGQKEAGGQIKLGEDLLNCGMKSACPGSSVAVHLFTGVRATELPKICINGK